MGRPGAPIISPLPFHALLSAGQRTRRSCLKQIRPFFIFGFIRETHRRSLKFFPQPRQKHGKTDPLVVGPVGVGQDDAPTLALEHDTIPPLQFVVGLEGMPVRDPGLHGAQQIEVSLDINLLGEVLDVDIVKINIILPFAVENGHLEIGPLKALLVGGDPEVGPQDQLLQRKELHFRPEIREGMMGHGSAVQAHAALVEESALAHPEPQHVPHRGLSLLVLAAPENIVGYAVGQGVDPAHRVIPLPDRQVPVDPGHPALVQGVELGIALGVVTGNIPVGHLGAHNVPEEIAGIGAPAVIPGPGAGEGHPGIEQGPGDDLLRRAVGHRMVNPEEGFPKAHPGAERDARQRLPLDEESRVDIDPVAGHAVVLVKVVIGPIQGEVDGQPAQRQGDRQQRGTRHPVEQVGVVVDQFFIVAGVEGEVGQGKIPGQQKTGNPGIHLFLLQIPAELQEEFPGIAVEAHVAEIEVRQVVGVADPVQGAPGLPIAQRLVDHPRGPVAAVGGVLRVAVVDIEEAEIGCGLVVAPAAKFTALHVPAVGEDGLVKGQVGVVVDGPIKRRFHHRAPGPVLPIGGDEKAALPGTEHRQDGHGQIEHGHPGQMEKAVPARGEPLHLHGQIAGGKAPGRPVGVAGGDFGRFGVIGALPGLAQQGAVHVKVILFEEEPGALHLAAAGRQVKLALLAGEDVVSQDQDHVALDPGDLRGLAHLHLIGGEAAVPLADHHVAFGSVDMVGGIIGDRIGADPPGPPLEAFMLEQVHLRGRAGAAPAEQENQAPQGQDAISPHRQLPHVCFKIVASYHRPSPLSRKPGRRNLQDQKGISGARLRGQGELGLRLAGLRRLRRRTDVSVAGRMAPMSEVRQGLMAG